MKTLKTFAFLILAGIILISCNQETTEKKELSGPYLGQKPPGLTPETFGPDFISTEMYERDLVISPDGKEIYFCVLLGPRHKWRIHIAYTKEVNGVWTKPEVVPFTTEYSDVEPFITRDNKRMYFISSRPLVDGEENKFRTNMWYTDRTSEGWSEPKPVGDPINGYGAVYYPSFTKTNTMYFVRNVEGKGELVHRSKLVDGKFMEPELLPEQINGGFGQCNVYVSPDEDFLIVPAVVESENYGGGDYYVSFRDENDNWSELINLGNEINSPIWDFCPSLSPDGKYFFFQREVWDTDTEGKRFNYDELRQIQNGGGDIYWVDAQVIHKLNPFKK